MCVESFEFPYLKASNTLVRYHKGAETGTYYDVDIVEPKAFMLESRYDDFEVNGYNIKELIRKYLKSASEMSYDDKCT